MERDSTEWVEIFYPNGTLKGYAAPCNLNAIYETYHQIPPCSIKALLKCPPCTQLFNNDKSNQQSLHQSGRGQTHSTPRRDFSVRPSEDLIKGREKDNLK